MASHLVCQKKVLGSSKLSYLGSNYLSEQVLCFYNTLFVLRNSEVFKPYVVGCKKFPSFVGPVVLIIFAHRLYEQRKFNNLILLQAPANSYRENKQLQQPCFLKIGHAV